MIFYLSIPAETITKSLWKHALCVGSNPTPQSTFYCCISTIIFELDFDNRLMKRLAMQIELYFTLQGDLSTSQTLLEALRDISIVALLHLFLEFNDH
jgi:hypothetical protein